MAPNDGKISAIRGREIFKVDPIDCVNAYKSRAVSHMSTEDRMTAVAGLYFTQPDMLPAGYNQIAARHNYLDEGNGLLGTIGRYIKDEDGNLVPPIKTFELTC